MRKTNKQKNKNKNKQTNKIYKLNRSGLLGAIRQLFTTQNETDLNGPLRSGLRTETGQGKNRPRQKQAVKKQTNKQTNKQKRACAKSGLRKADQGKNEPNHI